MDARRDEFVSVRPAAQPLLVPVEDAATLKTRAPRWHVVVAGVVIGFSAAIIILWAGFLVWMVGLVFRIW
jgi:hypothetical protein